MPNPALIDPKVNATYRNQILEHGFFALASDENRFRFTCHNSMRAASTAAKNAIGFGFGFATTMDLHEFKKWVAELESGGGWIDWQLRIVHHG